MELLDRYLISVQQDLDHSLSHEKREDIIKEIRANILDELDAQTQQSGQKETDAQADALKDVLKQYGHPAATAQRYAPQAPLVKSEDMALYKKVLWHGAAVIFVFALLKTISSMLQSDSINPIRLLLQTGGHFLENIGLMLLIVTLCFYYLGKTQSLAAARYKNWTLEKLPEFPQATIKISDTLTDLISASFLLLVLWTPLWMSEDTQQSLVFSLDPAQEHWRYILTVLSLSSCVFALYRLSQATWQRWSLQLYVVENLVFGFAFLWMASVENFLNINAQSTNANWQTVIDWAQQQLSYSFAIIGIIILIIAGFQLYRLNQLSKSKIA
jgi:hypothetical protein